MGIGSVKLFLNVTGKIINLVWATCPQTKDTMGESRSHDTKAEVS